MARGVDTPADRYAFLLASLTDDRYTAEQMKLAEVWILKGNWQYKGTKPLLELSDFYPEPKQIGELAKGYLLVTSTELAQRDKVAYERGQQAAANKYIDKEKDTQAYVDLVSFGREYTAKLYKLQETIEQLEKENAELLRKVAKGNLQEQGSLPMAKPYDSPLHGLRAGDIVADSLNQAVWIIQEDTQDLSRESKVKALGLDAKMIYQIQAGSVKVIARAWDIANAYSLYLQTAAKPTDPAPAVALVSGWELQKGEIVTDPNTGLNYTVVTDYLETHGSGYVELQPNWAKDAKPQKRYRWSVHKAAQQVEGSND